MRYEFVLYFVSISQAVPVDIPYKEGTDRTLLRQIQITAVYWSGFFYETVVLCSVSKRHNICTVFPNSC